MPPFIGTPTAPTLKTVSSMAVTQPQAQDMAGIVRIGHGRFGMMQYGHGRFMHRPFLHRLHPALMSLRPCEGRAVAFVLGTYPANLSISFEPLVWCRILSGILRSNRHRCPALDQLAGVMPLRLLDQAREL